MPAIRIPYSFTPPEQRMRRLVPAILVLLVAGVPPRGASAQDATIRGFVTDTAGTALEGARVEAWGSERLVATRVTGDDGAFTFPARLSSRVDLLRARRLGYRQADQPTGGTGGTFRLRLQEEPIPIRGLEVASEAGTCRMEDEERARRLWAAMSRRYAGAMDTVGIASYLAEDEALLAQGEIGPLEPPEEMLGQRGSSSQLRFSWTRRARRSGYAFPVRRTEKGVSFDSWSYAPLEADFAPHFVDAAFAELHRFRIRDEGTFGWIIEFCPRDPDRPSIHGSLRLAPDTTLASVDWLFETPEPDETAGGRAVFTPREPMDGGALIPLPTESLVWRRLPTGEFQEVHQRYEEWIVAQGDTVPFLTPR